MTHLNIKKYFLILSGFLLFSQVYSQQAPVFTQYNSALMYFNAGRAGLGKGICAEALIRQQWVGFKDANGNAVSPQDFLITIDSPVKWIKGGLGASILQDKAGFESNVVLQLAYSYHLHLNDGVMGIGAGINLTNRSIDFSKFIPVQSNDPVLLSGKPGDMLIDANVGVFYKSNKRYYAGFSVTNLFKSTGKNLSTAGQAIHYRTDRTFYFISGYVFSIPGKPEYQIEPSLLIQSDLKSTQYNLTTVVNYKNKFWGGLHYRLQESVGIMVGIKIKDIKIGYSYDLPTLPVGLAGSHEISIRYCFKIKTEKTNTKYKNTRYL